MPNAAPDTIRRLALIKEVTTAVYLIQEGLISLNLLSGANDFAHLPILLLSNGFERLLKMIWCLDYLQREGKFPAHPTYDRHCKHHKVTELLEQVISIAERWNYSERCEATKTDMDFLQHDADLKRIVALLERYAQAAGRYYNIDVIVGKKHSEDDDPVRLFDSYCDDIFFSQSDWQNKITGENLGEKMDVNIRYVNHHITTLLQRFARALCRMFTMGRLGQIGSQQTGTIGCFLFLQDKDLGQVQSRWFEP
jgi:hypothetical protein